MGDWRYLLLLVPLLVPLGIAVWGAWDSHKRKRDLLRKIRSQGIVVELPVGMSLNDARVQQKIREAMQRTMTELAEGKATGLHGDQVKW